MIQNSSAGQFFYILKRASFDWPESQIINKNLIIN
jgi:hypothetical protein